VDDEGAFEVDGQGDLAAKEGACGFGEAAFAQGVEPGFADAEGSVSLEEIGEGFGPGWWKVLREPGMDADGGSQLREAGGLIEYGLPVVGLRGAINEVGDAVFGGPAENGVCLIPEADVRQVDVGINEGGDVGVRGQGSFSVVGAGSGWGAASPMVMRRRSRLRRR